MEMTLSEAIDVLDGKTRKEALAKYENINQACNTAIDIVLGKLRDFWHATSVLNRSVADELYEDICAENLEGKDDELVVIETSALRRIIDQVLGVEDNVTE